MRSPEALTPIQPRRSPHNCRIASTPCSTATARGYRPTKRLLMPVDLESHHSVLVGRYFHSFKEMDGRKVVDGQGQVVEQINDKYFLVRIDWRVGTGCVQQVITLEEMLGWHFYENVEECGSGSSARTKRIMPKSRSSRVLRPPKLKSRQPPRWSAVFLNVDHDQSR